jgi:hypothetical protein
VYTVLFVNPPTHLAVKVVDGNFIVRNAVGSKPTILGRKLRQSYFRGENYFELDVDISSSAIAQRIVGIAGGCAKLLTVDMALVLQVIELFCLLCFSINFRYHSKGDSAEELPECPFAAMRIIGLDFDTPPMHPPVVASASGTGPAGTRAVSY